MDPCIKLMSVLPPFSPLPPLLPPSHTLYGVDARLFSHCVPCMWAAWAPLPPQRQECLILCGVLCMLVSVLLLEHDTMASFAMSCTLFVCGWGGNISSLGGPIGIYAVAFSSKKSHRCFCVSLFMSYSLFVMTQSTLWSTLPWICSWRVESVGV